jgi:Xaa-Pro aminopeptidase
LENLYVVSSTGVERDDRAWLKFAPLTWIPFDPRLIDDALLDDGERAWLADYHRECRSRLAPHLSAKELARLDRWLRD